MNLNTIQFIYIYRFHYLIVVVNIIKFDIGETSLRNSQCRLRTSVSLYY